MRCYHVDELEVASMKVCDSEEQSVRESGGGKEENPHFVIDLNDFFILLYSPVFIQKPNFLFCFWTEKYYMIYIYIYLWITTVKIILYLHLFMSMKTNFLSESNN
jgi:hypothetical protein